MPTDEFKRLGEQLRTARVALGMSLNEVAAATEMSPSFISHVENGKGDISFTRLRRLVHLYGITLMDLVAPHAADDRIVRAGERQDFGLEYTHANAYMLTPDASRLMMPILCVYERGGGSPEPIVIPSEEFIHVIHGTLEIAFEDGETLRLETGDSIYLVEPERPRIYRNASRGRTETLSVISPATL